MQARYVNTSEREQSQIRENCFEVRAPLLYVLAFNTMKDFHYNDPARSLGAATPTTSLH